jgi:hypothetical protein
MAAGDLTVGPSGSRSAIRNVSSVVLSQSDTRKLRFTKMSKNHLPDVDRARASLGESPKPPAGANSNGYSHIIDDNSLRLMLAREAIDLGRLPARRADRMWDAPCNGARCAVCGLVASQEELGYVLEFAQDGDAPVSHHLHVRCFAAWESECRNAESAVLGDAGARNVLRSPDDGTLSANGRAAGHRPEPG